MAKDSAGRLQRIVRKAQRNFEFATIYEQRKTNEILIAGFATLGEAIYGLGSRLEQSIGMLCERIDDLSSSMEKMNKKIIDAVRDVSSAVGEVSYRVGDVSSLLEEVSSGVGHLSSAIEAADTRAQATISEQAARQEKANKMLDNIQRHRVPPPFAEH
jgi:methyl-accepting chemotaxis protein